MARVPDRPDFYAAAEAFRERALRRGDSLFTPGQPVWGRETVDDLYRRFVEQPDESRDTFERKFHRQLEGAVPRTIQLAGELLYVYLLIAGDIGLPKKREQVETVLSWTDVPAAIPPDLADAMAGIANTGVAFKTYRPFQMALILDLTRALHARSQAQRDAALDDPWAFKQLLFGLPLKAAHAQREALLHLAHPDTFEPIVSRDHKQTIAQTFRDRLEQDVGDVDRALAAIRAALQADGADPGSFSFYDEPVVSQWRAAGEPEPTPPPDSQRAWLVRLPERCDESLGSAWIDAGYVGLGWSGAGEIRSGTTRAEILSRLEAAYRDESPTRRRTTATSLDSFLNRIRAGDLVVTPWGSGVFIGVVDGAPEWATGEADAPDRRRRPVSWANPGTPIPYERLSPGAASKLRHMFTVGDVTEHLEELRGLAGLDGERAPVDVLLPPATPELAEALLLDVAWLDEAIELLQEKRQLVFYGPPGTGKTYVAQRLAQHLTSAGGSYTLVQFHPSYAYEDFFEGFRPRQSTAGAGTLAFDLVPGPLRTLSEAARGDPAHPYLLIVDELNRANLAKVFGELYFLLEYREESVTLQYSRDDTFSLPRNLLIIGTMNTADRSIALVDAALRRRFYFLGFFPRDEPVRGLLRRWLRRRGHPEEAAALLDVMNRRIDDPDLAVGPSYLMTDRVASPQGMERVWRHAILPLLEEQYAGSGRDVAAEFGLPALRAALRQEPDEPPPEQ